MMPLVALVSLTAAAPPAGAPREDASARIVGKILTSSRALEQLAELTDTVGSRLSGSPGGEAAVAWALKQLQDDGLHAWTEPVRVPRWERRSERGWIEATPGRRAQPLALTALGGSPGTPPGGLAAEVIEVRGLDELERLGDRVRGRTVLFQHDMASPDGYGRDVALRSRGPAAAAKLGAAAALVRSLATSSLRTPHTGQTTFPPGAPQIPAAALATEDAELIHRRLAAGPVRVRLALDCGLASPP